MKKELLRTSPNQTRPTTFFDQRDREMKRGSNLSSPLFTLTSPYFFFATNNEELEAWNLYPLPNDNDSCEVFA